MVFFQLGSGTAKALDADLTVVGEVSELEGSWRFGRWPIGDVADVVGLDEAGRGLLLRAARPSKSAMVRRFGAGSILAIKPILVISVFCHPMWAFRAIAKLVDVVF